MVSFWKDHLFGTFEENIISPCIFFREISSFPIIQERSYSSAILLGRPFFHGIWEKEIGFSVERWLIKLKCTRHLSHYYHFFRESYVIFRSWKSGPSSSELLGDLNWRGNLIWKRGPHIPFHTKFSYVQELFGHISTYSEPCRTSKIEQLTVVFAN